MNYQQISKLTGVKPNTIVKWMVEHKVFTEIPYNIFTDSVVTATKYNAFYHIVLPGNPTVKKNSNTTARGMRLPNKLYGPYQDYMLAYLENNTKLNLDTPMTLFIKFYRTDKRRVDISNLYEAPQDILVKAGVLADDNCQIVVSHHQDSRVLYDTVFPRTEIYMLKVADVC